MSPSQEKRSSRIVGLLSRASGVGKSVPVTLSWLQSGECEGSKHHSPSPLVIRPIYLTSLLGEVDGSTPVRAKGLVYLCATCRDNVTVYLSILHAYDGEAPLAVRRDFGNLVLALGDKAWGYRQSATPV